MSHTEFHALMAELDLTEDLQVGLLRTVMYKRWKRCKCNSKDRVMLQAILKRLREIGNKKIAEVMGGVIREQMLRSSISSRVLDRLFLRNPLIQAAVDLHANYPITQVKP
jgi:hypothetical protein